MGGGKRHCSSDVSDMEDTNQKYVFTRLHFYFFHEVDFVSSSTHAICSNRSVLFCDLSICSSGMKDSAEPFRSERNVTIISVVAKHMEFGDYACVGDYAECMKQA